MIVKIRLTGLCAFVKNPTGSAMRVVLVDSSSHPPCDRHQPALLVPASFWDANQNVRIPTDVFVDKDYGQNVVVLPLSNEDLVFPRGNFSLSLNSESLSGESCPTEENLESFEWVAKTNLFVSDGGMRDAVLTAGTPTGVAARLRMTSGVFSTGGFREGPKPAGGSGIVKYEFDDAGGATGSRAFAEEVFMVDDNASPSFYDITATAFGGGTNPTIRLTKSGGLVDFKVVNLPLDKIKNPSSSKPFEPDGCFVEFYQLGSQTGSGLTPIVDDLCDTPGGGLSNPKCPCACFDDNSNA